MPTEETHVSAAPTEAETEPPAAKAPAANPTFAAELPTEVPSETFAEVNETVYAIANVNVRSGSSTDDPIIGSLCYGDSVQRTGIGSQGWSRVVYNGREAYVYASYLSTVNPAQDTAGYPKTYSDATCAIEITKEWYENAWCYIAHLQFTDYTRFGTSCANGGYGNGYEITSHAASRLDAIFAVNGCYSAPYLNYIVVRSGELCNGSGRSLWCPAVYSSRNGLLQSAWESGGTAGIAGANVDALVESGLVTDTFCFGPPILAGGSVTAGSDTSRAQRTFIGTNGNPGDIWIVVSEGRYADGESAGLTYNQCARLLSDKGCSFGIPLDGGGSSTMVFQGKVLNSARSGQRAVVDFVYFK
ncbi:MAG TPA: phosphodiester glycosidase family protein [Candidatus Faecousia intestinigallinarum]|nr:phosphodiester glycosidase family protein [Candidatus Faecousia intestinigallinarum]